MLSMEWTHSTSLRLITVLQFCAIYLYKMDNAFLYNSTFDLFLLQMKQTVS